MDAVDPHRGSNEGKKHLVFADKDKDESKDSSFFHEVLCEGGFTSFTTVLTFYNSPFLFMCPTDDRRTKASSV